ncbi:MAG: TetR/AcrR family transcriptional regulator [Myxococcota bacterium]
MTPTPPSAPNADKRARILRAAHEVCAKRGVEGARMEEVAALARVSKGTLYHFFESKRDLFLASIIDSYEESLALFEPPREGEVADPRAHLEAVLQGLVRVQGRMASRMTVHYQAWGVVAGDVVARERLYRFLTDFFAERSAEIVGAIEAGQRSGAFSADADVAAFNDGIAALLAGFLYRATFDPEHATTERLEACFDALIRAALYIDAPSGGGDELRRDG